MKAIPACALPGYTPLTSWPKRRASGLACILLALVFSSFQALPAAQIAFFSNPSFGDESTETPTLRAAIVAAGHTVTDFSATDSVSLSAVLSGKNALVLPEFEDNTPLAAFDAASRAVILSFVSSGGGLMVTGSGGFQSSAIEDFLNAVFGWSTVFAGNSASDSHTLNVAAAVGTPFSGGAATLPGVSLVSRTLVSSLPGGAHSIYENGVNSAVWFVPVTSGWVIFNGNDGFQPYSPEWTASINASLVLASAPGSSPPTVTVTAPTNIMQTTATLNGTVNPKGKASTAQFEYGLTNAYGSTASVTLSPNNGTTAQNVSANLSGLIAGATYHYRLSATNADGTSDTTDATFTTSSLGLVALTGTQAPGFPAGANFSSFSDASVNSAGRVVFSAKASGAGVTTSNDAGFWAQETGGVSLILREGVTDAGGGATVAEPIKFGRWDDTDVSHVISNVAGPGVSTANNLAGWVDNGTTTTGFVRKGTQFVNFFNGVSEHNGSGDGYLAAQLKLVSGSVTAANDTGVWGVAANGTVSAAVREGTVIDGTSKVGNLMSRVAVGSNGTGVYPAYMTGVPSANNRVLFKQDFEGGGAPVIVAFSGVPDSSPGVANGMFNGFTSESVNDSGKVAFAGILKTGVGGVSTANDVGIWRENAAGNLELVLRENQQVPGRPVGAVFHSFSQHWLLDDGSLVVLATLRGIGVDSTNNTGLWRVDPAGNIFLVLGSGQTLAQVGNSQVQGFYLKSDVCTNGDYAAVVILKAGTGNTVVANNQAILAGNVATPGVFHLLLRRADQHMVGGTAKTIKNALLSFFSGSNATTTGGAGGMSRAVNDSGKASVLMQFTDGSSGLFVGPNP